MRSCQISVRRRRSTFAVVRVLFLANARSVHTARWIGQLRNQGWDLHVFDFANNGVHDELRDVTVHLPTRQRCLEASVQVRSPWPFERGASTGRSVLPGPLRSRLAPERIDHLMKLVGQLRPDLIHVLEMQHNGYPLLTADAATDAILPHLVYSSWGSDLFWFRRFAEDAEQIRRVLKMCDYYIADCERDIVIAHEMGFRGEVLGVFPVAGGLRVGAIADMAREPPSRRRTIAVKGYENWHGRALAALDAIADVGPALLAGYVVEVYSGGPGVADRVDRLNAGGIQARVLREATSEEIWRLMARSRVAVALSESDGIPMSLIEAVSAGAYPVQSDTVSTGEVITGDNGALVDHRDPRSVTDALVRALTDDALVDGAAQANRDVAVRFDERVVRAQVISAYERVAADGGHARRAVTGGTGRSLNRRILATGGVGTVDRMPWRDISDDPNSQAARAARRRVLDAARADRSVERLEVIRRHCEGRKVLDLGCVDHRVEAVDQPEWLHRFVVDVSEECLGVDIEPEGLEKMRRQGYQVLLHDITGDPGPLIAAGPFDTVVAGELIEHLDCPRALFDVARDVLRPGGHLVITTPNPFGRARVRAGQLGITWENVDHITYVPPTGLAEMAERAGGLRLVLYGSEEAPMHRPTARSLLWHTRLWIRRDPVYLTHVDPPTLLEWIIEKARPRQLRGEVMTYVLQRVEQ